MVDYENIEPGTGRGGNVMLQNIHVVNLHTPLICSQRTGLVLSMHWLSPDMAENVNQDVKHQPIQKYFMKIVIIKY